MSSVGNGNGWNERKLNSYDYSNYTVHQGHVRNHRAGPTTLQHLRSPQTYHYATTFTD